MVGWKGVKWGQVGSQILAKVSSWIQASALCIPEQYVHGIDRHKSQSWPKQQLEAVWCCKESC